MSGFNLFQVIFILVVFFLYFIFLLIVFFLYLEKFAKVTKFLIEHLSTDWKRFAYKTHLKDIEFIVEDIDLDYDDDKSKMASLLEQIFKIDPLQYKYIIGNSLIALGKFDILFGVALDGKIIFLCFYIKALVKCCE